MRRSRSLGLRVGACHAFALLLGCGPSDGLVEVAWQIDDATLTRLYPQGVLTDTCGLESASAIRYDLRVRLQVVQNTDACAADPAAETCLVYEELFECHRYRGTATAVEPSSASDDDDPGYLMFVDLMIDPTDTPAFVPNSSCMQGPGPRVRSVKPGRLTDLEVYQFVFSAYQINGDPIDIDGCREVEVPETGTTGTETGGAETGTTGP